MRRSLNSAEEVMATAETPDGLPYIGRTNEHQFAATEQIEDENFVDGPEALFCINVTASYRFMRGTVKPKFKFPLGTERGSAVFAFISLGHTRA